MNAAHWFWLDCEGGTSLGWLIREKEVQVQMDQLPIRAHQMRTPGEQIEVGQTIHTINTYIIPRISMVQIIKIMIKI